MIDPTKIDELTDLLAEIHKISKAKLKHSIALYIEPEEVALLRYLHRRNVKTVSDFLIWCTYYAAYVPLPSVTGEQLKLGTVKERIATL